MSTYDAPNQQVVRPDGSAPWDEGDGGTGGTATPDKRGPGRPPKQLEPEETTPDDENQ